MSRSSFTNAFVLSLAFISLLAAWEITSNHYASLQFLLPAPTKIAAVLWEHADRFQVNAFATFKEMVGGFALAFVVSFPLAWLMAYYGPLRAILQPVFVAVQCIPMFALAPLMVLWFGWSFIAVAVPTALMIFFPLTINIYQGICSTPRSLLEFFRLHEATATQIFFKLQLPWALPHIFAGFRISVAMAGIGAVAGEWAGAQQGLGILMLESRRAADMEMMFGAMVWITCMSLFFYGLVVYFERIIEHRQNRSRAVGGLVSGLIFFCLFCGSCHQSPSPLKETTLLLDWLPNPNHLPLYAGVEQGFFEEEGIRLKILKVPDPSHAIQYLASKQVGLCLTYMPSTLLAMSRGAPVLPIGIVIQEPLNCIIYRTGEGIVTPKDLNDKIIGYSVDGFQTRFLETMLKNQKIVPERLYNVSFDLVGMLATHHVDAIYGAYWNIEMESLRSHGTDTGYFSMHDFNVPSYYELLVLALKDTPEANPDFISSFQRAFQKSIDYAKDHPQEAFDDYIKSNPDKSLKTRKWEWQAWLKTIPVLPDNQHIDPIKWNAFVDWLISQKLISDEARNRLSVASKPRV